MGLDIKALGIYGLYRRLIYKAYISTRNVSRRKSRVRIQFPFSHARKDLGGFPLKITSEYCAYRAYFAPG
jgi:hypothetical protein